MRFLDREHFTPHFFSTQRQGTVTGAVTTLLGTLLGKSYFGSAVLSVCTGTCVLLTTVYYSYSIQPSSGNVHSFRERAAVIGLLLLLLQHHHRFALTWTLWQSAVCLVIFSWREESLFCRITPMLAW